MKTNFRLFILIVVLIAMVVSACGAPGKVTVVQGKNASENFVKGTDGKLTLVEGFEITVAYCEKGTEEGQWVNCSGASNVTVTRDTFNKNTVGTEYIP